MHGKVLYFSTISSLLNGSAAIAWSDVIKPFVKMTDTTATKISKMLGDNFTFLENKCIYWKG